MWAAAQEAPRKDEAAVRPARNRVSVSGVAHDISPVERRLDAPRAAGVAGLVFAVLFVVSVVLLRRHPEAGSTAEEVRAWYLGGNASRVGLVGLYLMPFAGIAFLWFLAVMRHRISALEDRFFDTVLTGSGIIFIAMLFATAASAGSLVAAVKFRDAPAPGPEAVGVARSLAYTFFYVYALRAAAVFVVVASTIGRRGGGIPRWLALAGYAVALVLLLSVAYAPIVALLFPAWVAAVSIVVLTGTPGGKSPA
jgi:hypothetical protein